MSSPKEGKQKIRSRLTEGLKAGRSNQCTHVGRVDLDKSSSLSCHSVPRKIEKKKRLKLARGSPGCLSYENAQTVEGRACRARGRPTLSVSVVGFLLATAPQPRLSEGIGPDFTSFCQHHHHHHHHPPPAMSSTATLPTGSAPTKLASSPPFRHEHVGSFLRPRRVHEARAQFGEGKLDAAALRAVEDEEIAKHIKDCLHWKVRDLSDGEFRRQYFHIGASSHSLSPIPPLTGYSNDVSLVQTFSSISRV